MGRVGVRFKEDIPTLFRGSFSDLRRPPSVFVECQISFLSRLADFVGKAVVNLVGFLNMIYLCDYG